MNLNDYERSIFRSTKPSLRRSASSWNRPSLAADNLPWPQSIQCRAKEIESLRRRLAEEVTWTPSCWSLIGVISPAPGSSSTLIMTLNRFLASPLIRDNFEIEEDSLKIHHPTQENKETRYRAVHYTVRLREDRIRLPEYARFAGLRCEIQVQTILNHAWSEPPTISSTKTNWARLWRESHERYRRRFKRIMDKYLHPGRL